MLDQDEILLGEPSAPLEEDLEVETARCVRGKRTSPLERLGYALLCYILIILLLYYRVVLD